jgi:hypothetical protein
MINLSHAVKNVPGQDQYTTVQELGVIFRVHVLGLSCANV